MKTLLILPLLLTTTLPAFARYGQPGYSNQCFEEVYREEYTPGTRNSPGYVRRYTDTREVPCGYQEPRYYPQPVQQPRPARGNQQENSCVEGALLGGLAGGALGGTLALQDNWIWSIPSGVIGGAMLGCQFDGG